MALTRLHRSGIVTVLALTVIIIVAANRNPRIDGAASMSAMKIDCTQVMQGHVNQTLGLSELPTDSYNAKRAFCLIWEHPLADGSHLLPFQAAAVVGTLWPEAHLRPTQLAANNKGYGIAGWYAGERQDLVTWALLTGHNARTLDGQILFLLDQFEDSSRSLSPDTTLLQQIQATSSVHDIVTLIVNQYLGLPLLAADINARIDYATSLLA